MKVGFIGMGNMAGAICQGIIKSEFIKGEDVYSFDIDHTKLCCHYGSETSNH